MGLKKFLQTKPGAVLELFLFFAAALLPLRLEAKIPVLVLYAIGSLKIRRIKYSEIGFVKTDFTLKNVSFATGIAFLYFVSFHFLIDPLISVITSAKLPSVFDIHGNIKEFIFWLIVSWTVAAIGEEIIFRGYLLCRLMDLAGESMPAKSIVILFEGIAFGFPHYYQGMHGVISAGLFGMFQSILCLANTKKLILPIIVHGMYDTLGFISLFTGSI